MTMENMKVRDEDNQDSIDKSSVLDLMKLCIEYDMAFSYTADTNQMYVLYTSTTDADFAQICFDNSGVMEQAFMDWDGGIEEFSTENYFYKVLEEVRKEYLKLIYAQYGLIGHPSNRYKRRADYSQALSCLTEASNRKCDIEFAGDLIKVTSTRKDQALVQIAIALERGMYKAGMLRRQGITINVPDFESMMTILEYLES